MRSWLIAISFFVTFAAISSDEEIISNLEFLENMELMKDEEAFKVVQDENFDVNQVDEGDKDVN